MRDFPFSTTTSVLPTIVNTKFQPDHLELHRGACLEVIKDPERKSGVLSIDTELSLRPGDKTSKLLSHRSPEVLAEVQYLRQVALVDADGNQVWNFVSHTARDFHQFLVSREEKGFCQKLAMFIRPDIILVEWSTGGFEWV